MAGIKPPIPSAYPALRLATVLATLLFIISITINGLVPVATSHLAAAPAPAYGVGGGAGGGYGGAPQSAPQEAPAATQAPAQPFAQSIPAGTPTPSALLSLAPAATSTPEPPSEDNARVQGTPTMEFIPKAYPTVPANHQPTVTRSEAPVPFIWEIGLGALAIIFGIGAWSLRLTSDRKFRKKFTNNPKG